MKKLIFFIFLTIIYFEFYAQCINSTSGQYSTCLNEPSKYEKFGDDDLDEMIIEGIKSVLIRFSINKVEFFYYNDINSPNAKACGDGLEILLGEQLINDFFREYGDEKGSLFILAVIAHELGHIKQHNKSLPNDWLYEPTVMKQELHSDFLAGYYIGFMYSIEWAEESDASAFFELFFNLGSTKFNDPDFHGTAEQRQKAAMAGYKCGLNLWSIDQAFAKGITYINNNY